VVVVVAVVVKVVKVVIFAADATPKRMANK